MRTLLIVCMAFVLSIPTQAQQPADSTATDSATYWKQFELDEVKITAARKLVKQDIDKLTYDVANDEEAKTNNTLEMLRKVPMVTVDGQDNIRVKGSSSFKIYRNGHPDPTFEGSTVSQILKAIPANMIKKIEVITDPGAKYDAEGTTTILNIVMKDNAGMSGVAGTVSFTANHKGCIEPGVSLTTQTGKLTTSVNYGYSYNSKRQSKQISNSETTYANSGESDLSHTDIRGPFKVHYGNISASYEIDSLNLVSLSAGGYYYNVDMEGTLSTLRQANDGSTIYSFDQTLAMPLYDYYNINGQVDYQHKTHLDGEVLTLSYMGSTTRQNQNMDIGLSNLVAVPFSYTGYEQRQREKFFEHTAQVDYVRPIGRHNKVEVGGKYINRSNKSNTTMDYDGEKTADVYSLFHHTTQVAAAYSEWMATVGKLSLRGGLRYEYSHMKATYPDGSSSGFSKSLNDWCPSASVQYKMDDVNTLSLKYSTSIARPGISYLNPARIETPTSISEGAPGLNSARNQQIDVTFMHVGSKLTFSVNPSFYFTNNQIAGLQGVENGKVWTSYGNVNRMRRFYTSSYAQINPSPSTNISVNFAVSYLWYKNPNLNMKLDGWSGSYFVSFQQKLPWHLIFNSGLGGSYGRTPSSVYGFGGNWWYNYYSLQRSFLKEDRLTVRVVANNPFERHGIYKSRTVQGEYTGHSRFLTEQQQFGFSISYRFGSLKASVKKADHTISNDDVVGGIKQGGGK